jgi:hypothetical protein
MEENTKILFAWERNAPVCMVEKIKESGGGLTVTLLREPDIKLRAEPALRKRGYKDKLVFLPPTPPRTGEVESTDKGEEFKLVVGADGYAQLTGSVKLLIVIPNENEKIPPPVLIDTVPIDSPVSYKEEKKITKKV